MPYSPLDTESLEVILKKAQETGSLELVNVSIGDTEQQAIIDYIDSAKLDCACVLGVEPRSAATAILNKIDSRNQHSEKPIRVSYTAPMDMEGVESLNPQFVQTAKDNPKTSMFLEPSRLGNAFNQQGLPGLVKQVMTEALGNVPKFGGKDGYSQLVGVETLHSPMLEERFEQAKGKVRYQRPAFMDKLETLSIEGDELAEGEAMLYHGTSDSVANLIMASGFDEQRCQNIIGNGYGPLGKGVYLTPELSKAATFAKCGQCGSPGECLCFDENGDAVQRVVILARTFVGDPEVMLSKGKVNTREEPAAGCHSVISLAKVHDPNSAFNSTEVCVPKGAQIIPSRVISFVAQPSLLNAQRFSQVMKQNGLADCKMHGVRGNLLRVSHGLAAAGKYLKKGVSPVDVAHSVENLNRHQLGPVIDYVEIELKEALKEKRPDDEIQSLKRQEFELKSTRRQLNAFVAQYRDELKATDERVADFKAKKGESKQAAFEQSESTAHRFLRLTVDELNKGIKRDLKKSGYPEHRVPLTQAMITLQQELTRINESDASDPSKMAEACLLTEDLFDELSTRTDLSPDLHDKMQEATSYQLLSDTLTGIKQVYSDMTGTDELPGRDRAPVAPK